MKDFEIKEKDIKIDVAKSLKNKILYGETRPLHRLSFEGIPGLLQPPFEEGVLADQYRQLKRRLPIEKTTPFILMTSAEPGEGKTTASINLAMSFSLDKDWQICLIDCSGNENNCMQRLNVHAESGLMDFLEGELTNISEFILRTDYPNLKLLPFGKKSPRRYELLASRKMQHLVKMLPDLYENTIFILDAPELAVAEAKFLANLVGSVVLVLEQSKTPISKVKSCLHEVNQNKIAGVLLNKASLFSLTD